MREGVAFAVMPCCHGAKGSSGTALKAAAKALGLGVGLATDLGRYGVVAAAGSGYQARLRLIDDKITPENRIIIGLPRPTTAVPVAELSGQLYDSELGREVMPDDGIRADALERLAGAYKAAYRGCPAATEAEMDDGSDDGSIATERNREAV
jgi:hypothetical protein